MKKLAQLVIVVSLCAGGCGDSDTGSANKDAGGTIDAPVDMNSPEAGGRVDASMDAAYAADGLAPDAVQIVCDKAPLLKLVPFAKSTGSPMALVQDKGDPRFFVAERSGLIRILRDGVFDATPFLDMTASIAYIAPSSGERGLMNLVLHPDFAINGRFFVFYTSSRGDAFADTLEGDVVVAEGKRSDTDPNKAELTLKPLLIVEHSEDHPRKFDDGHNGGFLAFGPDGLLYAGVGDGGNGWDAYRSGQDAKQSLAKIYRLDVDQPLADPKKAAAAVWAMGARNPFRGSFDRQTGDLYYSEIGENNWEEVNFVEAGFKGALNFGWGNPGMEGTHCFPPFTKSCEPVGRPPVFEYEHAGASEKTRSRAVIGGFVYRGTAIPGLQGRYLLGDYAQNQVFSFVNMNGHGECLVDHTSEVVSPQTRLQGLVGFGQDVAGELYLFDLLGNIYRLTGAEAEHPG